MRFLGSLAIFFCSIFPALAQSKMAEKTSKMALRPGFVATYLDTINGKVWLLLNRFDRPFLYVNSLPAGLGSNDIGLDRGQVGASRIVFFQKIGKKVLLVQPNYEYRALSGDEREQRAVRHRR